MGPIVEPENQGGVFELGARYDGASAILGSPSDGDNHQGNHQGLGLFLTQQIVTGYDGSCFLDNLSDNTGVKFTFRLPIE